MNHREALNELSAGRVRPVYLIYGGEPFLAEELFQVIYRAVVQPETADFNYHLFHPGTDQVQQALRLSRTQPFFAQRRLVVLRDPPLFSSRRKQEESQEEESTSGDELVLDYLREPAATTTLIFLVGGNVDSRKKITKAAVATDGAVECKPLRESDAILWTQSRASHYQKKINDPAARTLVERLGPNLRLIDSELNKLSTYTGDAGNISTTDVEACVGGMAETEIFRLTESVMLKERAKALLLLSRILLRVDHPLQVLAALTNRFRQLLAVKALTARGVSLREGPALAKMHPFPYEKMIPSARSYTRAELIRALEQLLETDLAIKTGADPRLAIEMLVVELVS